MSTIHKLSYMVQIHGWHLQNVQVDCKVIIADAEILQVPPSKPLGVSDERIKFFNQACVDCLNVDPQRRMKRIFLRERLKDEGS